ncbi:MAG: flavodoxin-dependent (E)-4-hydroxy-3-methylbut-2-enyl-diphosphate synthase [Eubacterium sp.]|nr:flavodoxin-dependent (E)-4-hydroxy-3-methylbut-2-enyl-diphosphate synthase [Eubacterium sp.]
MNSRENTRKIKIGDVTIGGGNPIAIQSMTNTETSDIDATVAQILALEQAGCDIVRCTANTLAAAQAFDKLKERTHVPLVADIHFQYKLAIEAIEHGADKIRINPGNIGSEENLKAVVDAAKRHNVPIRVGVNSGSLEQQFIDKFGGVSAEGIVESALDKVRMIEEQDYDNIVISIKSSDVLMSVKTHQLISERTDYPLHVGITESGTVWSGNIKSSVGLGIILSQGIGDTIRVSLTGDPVEEVKTAKLILKTLDLRNDGISLVSCPTCGRTHIDMIGLANETEKLIANYSNLNIKVAVMGCAVNGPGEAREADLGIAGGDGVGLIFKKGEIIRKVPQEELLGELKKELDNWDK